MIVIFDTDCRIDLDAGQLLRASRNHAGAENLQQKIY